MKKNISSSHKDHNGQAKSSSINNEHHQSHQPELSKVTKSVDQSTPLAPNQIIQLQRSIGNYRTRQLLQREQQTTASPETKGYYQLDGPKNGVYTLVLSHFKKGSAKLKSTHYRGIDKLRVQLQSVLIDMDTTHLRTHERDAIWLQSIGEISGYASAEGPIKFNQTLSESRAQAVSDYLYSFSNVEAGLIEPVSIGGYGEFEASSEKKHYPKDRKVVITVDTKIFPKIKKKKKRPDDEKKPNMPRLEDPDVSIPNPAGKAKKIFGATSKVVKTLDVARAIFDVAGKFAPLALFSAVIGAIGSVIAWADALTSADQATFAAGVAYGYMYSTCDKKNILKVPFPKHVLAKGLDHNLASHKTAWSEGLKAGVTAWKEVTPFDRRRIREASDLLRKHGETQKLEANLNAVYQDVLNTRLSSSGSDNSKQPYKNRHLNWSLSKPNW